MTFHDRTAHSQYADGMLLSSERAAQIAAEPLQPSRAPLPRAGCPSSRNHEVPDAIERVRALVDAAAERVARYVNLRQAAGESGAAFVRRLVLAFLDEAAQ